MNEFKVGDRVALMAASFGRREDRVIGFSTVRAVHKNGNISLENDPRKQWRVSGTRAFRATREERYFHSYIALATPEFMQEYRARLANTKMRAAAEKKISSIKAALDRATASQIIDLMQRLEGFNLGEDSNA